MHTSILHWLITSFSAIVTFSFLMDLLTAPSTFLVDLGLFHLSQFFLFMINFKLFFFFYFAMKNHCYLPCVNRLTKREGDTKVIDLIFIDRAEVIFIDRAKFQVA
jgi:hypothetical protein